MSHACPDCGGDRDSHKHLRHCLGPTLRERAVRVPGARHSFWEAWGYPTWKPGTYPEMMGPCRTPQHFKRCRLTKYGGYTPFKKWPSAVVL